MKSDTLRMTKPGYPFFIALKRNESDFVVSSLDGAVEYRIGYLKNLPESLKLSGRFKKRSYAELRAALMIPNIARMTSLLYTSTSAAESSPLCSF